MTAEELEKIVSPAGVLMNVRASTFDECLAAFAPVVRGHPAIVDPDLFIESVRAREAAVSTADFLTTVFERFSRHDDERLPVLATDGSKRLLGAVSKADALLAFAERPKEPVS